MSEERLWVPPHRPDICAGIVPGKDYDETMCRWCWTRNQSQDKAETQIEVVREELRHIGVVATSHHAYTTGHKAWVCEALRSVNEQYYYNVVNKVFVHDGAPLADEIKYELSRGGWRVVVCDRPSGSVVYKRNAGLKAMFSDPERFMDILFVTFLDCDNFYAPNFFYEVAKLVRKEDSNRSIGVIAPRIISFRDDELTFSHLAKSTYSWSGAVRQFGENGHGQRTCNLVRYKMLVDTCCLFNPIAIWQAGLWQSETESGSHADNCLFYRVLNLGYGVINSLSSIVFYRMHGGSLLGVNMGDPDGRNYGAVDICLEQNIWPLQVLTIFNKEYCFGVWLDCFGSLNFPTFTKFHWVCASQDRLFYKKLLEAAERLVPYFINVHVLDGDPFLTWDKDIGRPYNMDKHKLHRVNGIYSYCLKNFIDYGYCLIYEDDCLVFDRNAVLKLWNKMVELPQFVGIGAPIASERSDLIGLIKIEEMQKVDDTVYEVVKAHTGPGSFVLYDANFLKAHLPITSPMSGWDIYYADIARAMGLKVGLRMDIVTQHFCRPDLCMHYGDMQIFKVDRQYSLI
jgi:hypothetical protein